MSKSKKHPDNQITFYQTPDGSMNIEVMYANENIWLPQKRMAELFGCTSDNISLHLKNIHAKSELDEKATTEDFSVVQKEVNHEVAIALAHKHFEKFRIEQDKTFISDFDKEIKKLTGNEDEQ